MSYEIELHKRVEKFLRKQDKAFLQRVDSVFEKLSKNPLNFKELDIKHLEGGNNDYRLRIGKYRFIYTIIENKLVIYIIENKLVIYIYDGGSRGDIYK
jgi:mRNA interferase RelE/StbE